MRVVVFASAQLTFLCGSCRLTFVHIGVQPPQGFFSLSPTCFFFLFLYNISSVHFPYREKMHLVALNKRNMQRKMQVWDSKKKKVKLERGSY